MEIVHLQLEKVLIEVKLVFRDFNILPNLILENILNVICLP